MDEVRFIGAGVSDVKPSQIHEHPRNYNQGDVGAIGLSIDSVGFYGRIIVSKRTKNIVAGNHRYRALVQAGAKTIPVEWVDVSEEDELRILAADNRTAQLATPDDAKLALLLTDLAQTERGFDGLGYEAEDLVDILGVLAAGSDSPEPASSTPRLRDKAVKPKDTELGVFIYCGSVQEQCELLERFLEEGLKCRQVTPEI